MKTYQLFLVSLGVVAIAAAGETGQPVDRSRDIPDFCQTDPVGRFPGGGGNYCGPVAVANSLMFLARQGFPKLRPSETPDPEAQVRVIHTLGSPEFMDTDAKHGTSPPRLMRGVKAFVEQAGYRIRRLEQQGWREGSKQFPAKVQVPSLEWMKSGLASPGGAVWLNVGWYKIDAKTGGYHRFGGHWVTLVGYGRDRDGRENPLKLIIHDPAPRTGVKPATQWISLSRLDRGTLHRKIPPDQERHRDAAGFYEMKGEMKLKSGADAAILDAAVVMQL